jgi:hypothetical protein
MPALPGSWRLCPGAGTPRYEKPPQSLRAEAVTNAGYLFALEQRLLHCGPDKRLSVQQAQEVLLAAGMLRLARCI